MDTEKGPRKLCRRLNVPGDIHELTFTCYKRRLFLSKDRTRIFLADAINSARVKHEFYLLAYGFMPEHAHLLVFPRPEKYDMSKILQSIKQPVAQRAIRYLRRENPAGLAMLRTGQKHEPFRFWQDGGGHDKNTRDEKDLANVIKYIHENPVRKGLVTIPEDWIWSSVRDWTGGEPGPIPIDCDSFFV